MRVYLETLGCRLNYAEMATLSRQLVSAGHHLSASVADADICVLNSCAVTGEAVRKSRQLVRQLAQSNPSARLIVTGCYATLEGESVVALPNVSMVVGNVRKDELLAIVEQFDHKDQPAVKPTNRPTVAPIVASNPGRTRAFVKVQDGCHNRCTFCIVTLARGEERSRAISDVIEEINELHGAGYQEAVLTGVHLGAYGHERGQDLRTLVEALLAATSIPRLRLSSLEPFDLTPDFFDLWQRGWGRLMPHLHLPAQSGSDPILRRMARRDRVGDYEMLVAEARARIPGLTLTTDLVVGFPGETEADFAETAAFAQRIGFAHLHVFPYSARAGTAAASFSGQVPEAERRSRSRILNNLNVELGRSVRQANVGQERPVLWENRSYVTSVPSEEVWNGLTDNYLRVLVAVPAGTDLCNRITAVRLSRLDGMGLWGELVQEKELR